RAMLTMTRVEAIPYEAMKRGLPWDWVTYPEFLDRVDRAPKAVNVLPYVPVAPLLVWVLGFERAKAGVLATDVVHDETALRLARVLGERNEGFMQTALATADGAHDFAHVEELAEVSGRPILYNVVQ